MNVVIFSIVAFVSKMLAVTSRLCLGKRFTKNDLEVQFYNTSSLLYVNRP